MKTIEIIGYRTPNGFRVTKSKVQTPDGRTWAIHARASGGFRLFEIDPEGKREPEEHNAVNGDDWAAGDVIDYLAAVGSR